MKPEAITALKKELEKNFGRKITSYRDCLQLVDDIYNKTESTVNVNTLRRFFGLVRTAYNPSPATLSIFSKYCGFNSIDDLENISVSASSETSINKEEVFHYLLSLFRNMPVLETPNVVTEAMLQQTVMFLERNPSLIDRFQREIAVTPAGQYYYFERYVNMDRLNDYYGDGLKYYARAKNSVEARIFANSLLVFRYWLTDDTSKQEKYMNEIEAVYNGFDYAPNIMGRLFASKLYDAHARNESSEKVLNDALKYYGTIAGKKGVASSPHFELLICEALALTNQRTEALEWLNRGKYFLPDKDLIPESYSVWENILKHSSSSSSNRNFLLAYKKNQKKNRLASTVFNKNYLQAIRLALNNEKKRNSELNTLVELTGYKKLLHLYMP
jgi:hypothetical protein